VQQGYYVSHDFRISGPVPTTAPMPDFGQGGMGGSGGAAGLFSSKGPLYDLFLGRTTGRAPLFIPAVIAIISIAIIAYVLKKER
jgi:hypothetical protein